MSSQTVLPVFKNPVVNNQLEEDGYAILPLLTQEDVTRLKTFYLNTFKDAELNLPFYTSIWSKNKGYREAVDKELKEVISTALSKHIESFQQVFSNLMVKQPGGQSSLVPHQDWSFVNEPDYESFTVWIPLSDVDEHNGALRIIPGSQLTRNFIRGRFFENPLTPYNEFLFKQNMLSVNLRAGEALILNSRLVHASPPNLSTEVRIAASLVIAPPDAELVHYFFDRNSELPQLKKAKITSSFYTDFHCFELPDIPAESIKYNPDTLYYTKNDLEIIKSPKVF